MSKEAVIKIGPDGSMVEVEGKTFEGPECEILRKFNAALGETVEEKKLDAYYLAPKQQVKI